MVSSYRVHGMTQHFHDREHWCSTNRLMGFGPLDQNLEARRSHENVPPAGCLEGSNWEAEGGARFDCFSIAKKP